MKRKFYWVDADVKLLFLGITFFISALAVVFILNYKQIPWYATAFLVFVSLFLWWVTFNSFKQFYKVTFRNIINNSHLIGLGTFYFFLV